MAKISALSFANNVDRNRKRLIQNCLKNGKNVSENEPLDGVVAINNEISTSIPDGYFKVEFKDLNGDYFAPTQYVRVGESAILPSDYPELDSEYLEFIGWEYNGDINNVQENIVCLPNYQTRFSEVANQRPTILICYFSEDNLSPTLQIGSTHTNTYVNWGDGSAPEQVTTTAISHTYSRSGLYSITVYGDSYSLGGASYGVFSNSGYSYSLIKAYVGENIRSITTKCFSACYSLTHVTIPNTIKGIFSEAFSYCYSLTNVIIPNLVTNIDRNAFYNCYSLTNIIIPNSVTTLGESVFSDCTSLSSLIIPNGTTNIPTNSFFDCYSLQKLTIPPSVVSFSQGVNNFAKCYSLNELILFEDFNFSGLILKDCAFSDECLIDIANKLKDNSGLVSNTITFSQRRHETRMNTIYLNEFGERVPYGTEGAVSILEFIQNKNWTVSFSN